jgi:hypothetical protein
MISTRKLLYNDEKISSELNLIYEIKSKAVDTEFQEFIFAKISAQFLFYMTICFTFIMLPLTIISLVAIDLQRDTTFGTILYILGFVCAFGGTVCGWILVFLHKNYTKPESKKMYFFSEFKKHQLLIQHLYLIFTHLYCIERFLRLRYIPCPLQISSEVLLSSIGDWNCRGGSKLEFVPGDGSLVLLLFPFICLIALKEARLWFSVMWHAVIQGVFLLGFQGHLTSVYIALVVIWLTGGWILFLDLHLQHVKMFFMTKELEITLTQNEKYADQMQAQEMKHLIANVAHDLKTVRKFRFSIIGYPKRLFFLASGVFYCWNGANFSKYQ